MYLWKAHSKWVMNFEDMDKADEANVLKAAALKGNKYSFDFE